MAGNFDERFDLNAVEAGAELLREIHYRKLVAFVKSAVKNTCLVSFLLLVSGSRLENHNQTDP